jgi:hypothetical protein
VYQERRKIEPVGDGLKDDGKALRQRKRHAGHNHDNERYRQSGVQAKDAEPRPLSEELPV